MKSRSKFRKKVSRKKSKKIFKKGSRVQIKNLRPSSGRGGFRL